AAAVRALFACSKSANATTNETSAAGASSQAVEIRLMSKMATTGASGRNVRTVSDQFRNAAKTNVPTNQAARRTRLALRRCARSTITQRKTLAPMAAKIAASIRANGLFTVRFQFGFIS